MVKAMMPLICPPCATLLQGDALGLLPPLNESPCCHCPFHAALLVPRTPVLPPPTGTGSRVTGCVFMCITCNGCTGATQSALQINGQTVLGRAETSEFSSPAGLPFSKGKKIKKLFLPRLVMGRGKVSARKNKMVKILTTPLLANGHLDFLDSNG